MKSIQEMLKELVDMGWSQSSLARELGTNQPTIHRLVVSGKEPGYTLGKSIESLYAEQQVKKAA